MAGDLDGRKSTSAYLFTIAGQSKSQKCVALPTTEAEYITATEAAMMTCVIKLHFVLDQ